MVAVDGFRLALRKEPILEKNGTSSSSSLEPPSARWKKSAGRPTIPWTSTRRPPRPLQNGGHHPHRPAAGGGVPAWRQAIPRNNPIKVTVETKQLLSCIERVSLIVSEKLKSPLRLRHGGGGNASNPPPATCHRQCPGPLPHGGKRQRLEIGFNNRYMMEALKAASREKVTLELSSPITPCIIVPADGRITSSSWCCRCG